MRKKPDDPMTNLGNSVQQTVEWATRIIAVCIFMGLIVWGGMQLDSRMESAWFTPIGLVLGIAFGMAGMILVVKRMEIAMEDKKRSDGLQEGDKRNADSNSVAPKDPDSKANNSSKT